MWPRRRKALPASRPTGGAMEPDPAEMEALRAPLTRPGDAPRPLAPPLTRRLEAATTRMTNEAALVAMYTRWADMHRSRWADACQARDEALAALERQSTVVDPLTSTDYAEIRQSAGLLPAGDRAPEARRG